MTSRGLVGGGRLCAAAQDGDEPEPQDRRDRAKPDHGSGPARTGRGAMSAAPSDHRRLHAAARQRPARRRHARRASPRREGVDLVARARDLLGQYPRPPRGRAFPGGAYAGADADRLQSRADAARLAHHRADGARARRQCGDRLQCAVGGDGSAWRQARPRSRRTPARR